MACRDIGNSEGETGEGGQVSQWVCAITGAEGRQGREDAEKRNGQHIEKAEEWHTPA